MRKCKVCLKVIKHEARLHKGDGLTWKWHPVRDGKILHRMWDWGSKCGMELTLFGGRA